ncbi:MAG: septation protein A, partial [Pseudomonadota bacterium]|nr:septation protein A [Pseudomonadota bacterium]
SLSIWLQDETFIKMKPTIVNALFGVALLGGLFFGKALLGYVFNAAFNLDALGWKKLSFRWGLFFLFLAVLNEVVWRNFSDDVWVNFKVWGTMPITLIFTFAQMPLIMRHTISDAAAETKP